MDKSIGEALRDIRKIKGYTQNEIVTTNLSRSTIAKIETNLINPSYDRITIFCKQIGISLDEVIYYQHNYSVSEKEKLIHEFRNLNNSIYKDPINKLISELDSYLLIDNDLQIIELKAILKAITIFTETDNVELARKEVLFIWERLEKQDEWFHFDILILAYIIFVFEDETLENVANKLMREIDKFSYFVNYKRLKLGLVLNLALFLKFAGKMDQTIKYIDIGIQLATDIDNLSIKYLAYHRKAEYLLYNGHVEQAFNLHNKALSFFEFIEDESMYEDLKNDWLKAKEQFNIQIKE
ncbi:MULTISPECIES: helix-turn-helix domain-containing protein [Listeria]|uniref:HTH cro/C1-type domain-containing protein n=1 Tax=Listeria monocytogenes TaxID=1639 RepID=A0AB37NPG4_LISMN|nr:MULTISPECIES: helix-turn-helix transcriptional regulator [Listeria]EAF7129894.1 Rgg/GadR/MutR family transcriptional regulator [Listeria monocytogenes]EAF7198145.1 Rgg/GadR/MutR family transcriptional regulator [Listeria monocytogenes]EJB6200945.1 helix-turn-helix domain-containing protein [Listeria monocytogenes]EXL15025.1 transcriptional activator, Rgg/GadR/MutR family, C-domain protein [Listeria monocytogenes Lm_1840]MDA5708686.1 helix-turn-helix domain-containing protein [Listeria monoc